VCYLFKFSGGAGWHSIFRNFGLERVRGGFSPITRALWVTRNRVSIASRYTSAVIVCMNVSNAPEQAATSHDTTQSMHFLKS
jgi:hypothetical protein